MCIAASVACGSREPPGATVVFVCEHGSAKSVVAAALFNDLSAKRALPFRAVSRGLDPDPVLAPAVMRGLASDGLVPPAQLPIRLTAEDKLASRVVFLGDGRRELGPHGETWAAIPAVSESYAASRDAIRTRINTLLDQLSVENR